MGCGSSAPTRQAPGEWAPVTTAAPTPSSRMQPKLVAFAVADDESRSKTGVGTGIHDGTHAELGRRKTGTMRRIAISAEALADDAVRDMRAVPKSAQVHEDLLGAMRSSPLFESLQPELLAAIIDSMEVRSAAAGDVIIKQGDPGDNLYVVESGVYDAFVRIGTSGEEKKVSEYCKGQSFGELALLYNSPRAATIRTREAGVCYMLDRSVFQHLVKGYSTK